MRNSNEHLLTIAARLDELVRCRQFIEEQGKALGIPEQALWRLVVACDEICSNIIRHGYRDKPDGSIAIRIYAEGGLCIVELRDNAAPYDPVRPDQVHQPALTKSGHGLILANRLAHIRYVPQSDDQGDNFTYISVPIK